GDTSIIYFDLTCLHAHTPNRFRPYAAASPDNPLFRYLAASCERYHVFPAARETVSCHRTVRPTVPPMSSRPQTARSTFPMRWDRTHTFRRSMPQGHLRIPSRKPLQRLLLSVGPSQCAAIQDSL